MKYKAVQIIRLKTDSLLNAQKNAAYRIMQKPFLPPCGIVCSNTIVLSLRVFPFVICLILTTTPLHRLKTEALKGETTWLRSAS